MSYTQTLKKLRHKLMYIQNKDNFTEVVDVVLYKYNSIDLRIWGLAKRNSGHKVLSEDSILIRVDTLRGIIRSGFRNELNRIDAIGDTMLHKEATSVYFLNTVFSNMTNLTWVKITLNKNSAYKRITNVDEIKTIKFSIKTIRGTFRLFDIYREIELPSVNRLLVRAGILRTSEHFKVLRLKDLLDRLDLYISENNTSDVMSLLNPIILKLEAFEFDNPEVLLITDIESDI